MTHAFDIDSVLKTVGEVDPPVTHCRLLQCQTIKVIHVFTEMADKQKMCIPTTSTQ